ncbi:hypothetical protein HCH_05718 [Hahella chejuensis KCTC 2396]|uniref:Uncharacterized protein n=1 Tax=Hahella chejuensis (strain KCTC 2396) TaxID=349521 RepID=Q2SAF2_HAHCH|nr:hypothetical protein HCH_05718 [Hahella chejuensis KCTC 2396]
MTLSFFVQLLPTEKLKGLEQIILSRITKSKYFNFS